MMEELQLQLLEHASMLKGASCTWGARQEGMEAPLLMTAALCVQPPPPPPPPHNPSVHRHPCS
jgi:hypothetical protein